MALITPILSPTPAFDANTSHTFYFQTFGGNQQVANNLQIRNNETNELVYNMTQNTFKTEHILPEGVLVNGTQYNARIIIYDAGGDSSDLSSPVLFYCYTEPSISFENIPLNNIIDNSSYNFIAQYSQLEYENLYEYEFILYNSNNLEISTSGSQFFTGGNPPNIINHNFDGFDNLEVYYIECKCITVNQTQISTGRIQITASYYQPNVNSLVYLENDCDNGLVNVISNMKIIAGNSNPSPPVYIDNAKVDLTSENSYVSWTHNLGVDGNFLVRVWGSNFSNNDIVEMYGVDDSDKQIVISWYSTPSSSATLIELKDENISLIDLKNKNISLINFKENFHASINGEIPKSYATCTYKEDGVYKTIQSNELDRLPDSDMVSIWLNFKSDGNIDFIISGEDAQSWERRDSYNYIWKTYDDKDYSWSIYDEGAWN